ncbi:MAG: hypothetical protein H0Z33_11445 [Bacillaceae bacterium]|nr:hypothetical protein [Bacillaceae bacterium]
MKRTWRVGSISMGMLLIMLGIALFWGNFSDPHAAVRFVINGWPIVLIILGVEVLWQTYFAGENSPKIKYDVMSILMIFVIGSVSLVFYSIQSVGLLDKVEAAINTQDYVVEIPEQTVSLSPEIKRVVITSSRNGAVTVESTSEDRISVMEQVTVSSGSESEEELASLVRQQGMSEHQVGDTLYLQFGAFPRFDDLYQQRVWKSDMILVLPDDVEVEMKTDQQVHVNLRGLQNKWRIVSDQYRLRATLGGRV